jgi:hypothetical protein
MGTPNSINKLDPTFMLHQVLIEGRPLDHTQLIAAGLDVAYLRAKHQNIKPQLPYIDDSYFAIEDYMKGCADEHKWRELIADARLTGQQCLSFSNRGRLQNVPYGAISIIAPRRAIGYSGPDDRRLSVDVFLLRSGIFVACCGEEMKLASRTVTMHDTADSLCRRLRDFVGESHMLERDALTPFPIILADKIDKILDNSLADKDRRREVQAGYRARNQELTDRVPHYPM